MNSCPVCSSGNVGRFCTVEDRDREGVFWEIWRCRGCGYGWTLPEIPPERIGAYYPPVYLGDTQRTLTDFAEGRIQRSRFGRRMVERQRLIEKHVAGGRILDVGCSHAVFLLSLDSAKWQCTGVEYIGEVVDLLHERFPRLEVFKGDIHSADLAHGAFDVVTFWHVFEHLYEPRRVLARTAELLRPGGWAFISLPNLESCQSRLFRRHWYAFDVPRHLHHYSPKALEILLGDTGFADVRHYFFSTKDDFHQLKHSLIPWSEEKFSSRLPYYLLKPALFGFQAVEAITGKYGTLTTAARLQEK